MTRMFVKFTTAVALACASTAAFAHAQLEKATPAVGGTVASPSEIRLEFSEGVEPKFSKISVTGPAGVPFEGGASNHDYVSPTDTLGGGPGQLHLFRLFGDATGDGVVDQQDLGIFRTTFNASIGSAQFLYYFDSDHSGTVDQVDLGQFRARFNTDVFV